MAQESDKLPFFKMYVIVGFFTRGLVEKTLEALSALTCNLSLSACIGGDRLNSGHHHNEFLELDFTVTVLINLLDDGVDGLEGERVGSAEVQDVSDLIS